MASRSELLIPSATLGSTNASAPRRYSSGVGQRAREMDAVGHPECLGLLLESFLASRRRRRE